MQATVKWVDGRAFLGESGSGHTVVMDGPADHGGDRCPVDRVGGTAGFAEPEGGLCRRRRGVGHRRLVRRTAAR